jgi:membrane AbrB-like protein
VIDRRRTLRTLLTLAIGAVGGATFGMLGLPAGWLTGSMVAVAIAAVAGAEVEVPKGLRNVAFVVVGSFLGASVSPELVGELPRWPISLSVLIVNLVVLQWAAQTFLHRVCNWDRQTAFFAAIPGLTSYVIALALPTHADTARIAVSQTIRLSLLMLLLPKAVEMIGGAPPGVGVAAVSLAGIAVTLAGGTLGGVVFSFVGIPAAPLLGALLVSGILHGTGLVSGGLAPPFMVAAYIVLGGLVGSRFAGITVKTLWAMAAASLGAFAVSMSIAIFGAVIAAWLTDQPVSQMILAFAPGGIDVMTIMAFALNLDAAFVAAHQLARFLMITVYAPLLTKRAGRRSESGE